MTNMKQTQDDRTIQPFNCSTIQRVKAYAFTLAETLIVIGIIGVVAALTLPNLNHATGDKEKVTKVKKIYSSLTDAFDRAQAVYGDYDTWFNDLDCGDLAACNERFAKRVTEFMKVSKECGFGEGCFSNNPLLTINGKVCDETDSYLARLIEYQAYMVTLYDGSSIAFIWANDRYGAVRVDADGVNKGKNQIGNDIFNFSMEHDYSNNTFEVHADSGAVSFTGNFFYSGLNEKYKDMGSYFTKWVIENGNLDYLKCPEELNWETKTSCE